MPRRPSSNHTATSLCPEKITRLWFERVVLGLNLCPFAHKPSREQTIRFVVSDTEDEQQLLATVQQEIQLLRDTPVTRCETTVIIVSHWLRDFYEYQFFISEAERALQRDRWSGQYQLASFHPDYCFAGTMPEDASNLTNRSPYPLIHILREASITDALQHVDEPESIPQKNIEKMERLTQQEKDELFFYLPKKSNR